VTVGYLGFISGEKKSVLGNCSSRGATATGEFVAGNGKVFGSWQFWVDLCCFWQERDGFICWSWRFGLARFESFFFFWFLVLVFISPDGRSRQAKLGFLVQTPGVYLSRLGFFCINMCVFVGSCNAEQLVFGRFKAEPPPFGIRLGFRFDSLGSSAAQVSSLINRVGSSGTEEMPWSRKFVAFRL